MTAGKNKLSRGNTLLIDDADSGTARNVSGDLVPGSMTGLGFNAAFIEMTGETDACVNGLADRKQNNLKFKLYANDTALTGASTVLHGIEGVANITVTYNIGSGGATPTTGDLKWEGEYVCLSATLGVDGGKLVHECEFAPCTSTAPAWSTV